MGRMNKRLKSYSINIGAIIVIYALLTLLMKTGIINSYYEVIVISIGINIILAASLNLATGYLGQLALGHAGFMAVGAYV